MITIISGVPGSGKTALLVEMMMKELEQGRKIFTIGIPRLLLNVQEGGDPHTWQDGTWLQIDYYNPAKTHSKGIKSEWMPRGCPDSCEWLSTCPRVGALNPIYTPDAGALVIIDESHTHFPQRASGKTPPPYIEALTVHRHQGLDIWFVSQRPSFLDPFVRGLSSRHIHLSLNPFSFTGSRNKYEWSEYQETVNRTSKLLAAKSDYKPSPAVFPLYASATVHTKLDQRMPTIMRVFLVALCIVLVMVGAVVYRVQDRMQSIKNSQASTVAGGIGGDRRAQTMTAATANPPPLGVSGVPLVPLLTESVPVSAVAAAPAPMALPAVFNVSPSSPAEFVQISACMASESRCQCYTHHGIKLPMSDEECRAASLSPNARFRLKPDSSADL